MYKNEFNKSQTIKYVLVKTWPSGEDYLFIFSFTIPNTSFLLAVDMYGYGTFLQEARESRYVSSSRLVRLENSAPEAEGQRTNVGSYTQIEMRRLLPALDYCIPFQHSCIIILLKK